MERVSPVAKPPSLLISRGCLLSPRAPVIYKGETVTFANVLAAPATKGPVLLRVHTRTSGMFLSRSRSGSRSGLRHNSWICLRQFHAVGIGLDWALDMEHRTSELAIVTVPRLGLLLLIGFVRLPNSKGMRLQPDNTLKVFFDTENLSPDSAWSAVVTDSISFTPLRSLYYQHHPSVRQGRARLEDTSRRVGTPRHPIRGPG
ncbi:hypothetical protein AnigIFM63604_003612 [Aspergillus niger]|nr:hypothetical protein AnigIFM63604_003612 [Aspergillus niger]